MNNNPDLKKRFNFLGPDLLQEIGNDGKLLNIPAATELVKKGDYVKSVPLVLDGVIKVYSRYQEKELLLYYIKRDDSCIMSFTSVIQNSRSLIYATTEQDSRVLLLPAESIQKWIQKYPALNKLFYNQYHVRYTDLLDTIEQLIFFNLEDRLLDYLQTKISHTDSKLLDITHRQIADDLGTAREVISRTIKKLERKNKIVQTNSGIKIYGV
jgi:CRP/FNR family transcriptional regulator, anaerobic regulatory protein